MSYINTKQLHLELSSLNHYCINVESTIVNKWGRFIEEDNDMIFKNYSKTSSLHSYYNFLLFPHPELHKLYFEIKNMFNEIRVHTGEYYITMWLNVHRSGEYLNWHNHNDPKDNAYHGYFSVNAEPSITTYKLPDKTIHPVNNKNNQLVLSRSDGDLHKVSEWDKPDSRITLAFDIVPYSIANNSFIRQDRTNNWMPI